MPLTGWCPYCMEPLPVASASPSGLSTNDTAAPAPAIVGTTVSRDGSGRRRRVVATLFDAAVFIPALVALAFSIPVALVLLAVAALFTVWQVRVLGRRTGHTIGGHLTAGSERRRVGVDRR